jgi:hypothetical protein
MTVCLEGRSLPAASLRISDNLSKCETPAPKGENIQAWCFLTLDRALSARYLSGMLHTFQETVEGQTFNFTKIWNGDRWIYMVSDDQSLVVVAIGPDGRWGLNSPCPTHFEPLLPDLVLVVEVMEKSEMN